VPLPFRSNNKSPIRSKYWPDSLSIKQRLGDSDDWSELVSRERETSSKVKARPSCSAE
jgi:hypothetical protein